MTPPEGRGGAAAGRAPRVLLVEDDPHTRRINALALSSAGFEIAEARDGIEAIAGALNGPAPDLIVMDLALPRVSGLEATARIRSALGDGAPPIIVLSARAMSEDAEAARRAGCDVFLAKPIDPFDLVHEARRLLDGRREAP